MAKFKKGDRFEVLAVYWVDRDRGIKVGDKGTILDNHKTPCVRMDKKNQKLGTAGGLCEAGHGWSLKEEQLKLIENATPEPLENWKHPYHGQPILVRDNEASKWKEGIFVSYLHESFFPVVVKCQHSGGVTIYKQYKFPDQEPKAPEYTIEEAEKEFNIKIKK